MLSKKNRLKGTANFERIFKDGEKFFSQYFVVYRLNSRDNNPQIGIVVSKKVGIAVKRNKAKRMISEAIKILLKEKNTSFDYIFILKKEILDLKLEDIIVEVKKIFY